VGELEIPAKFRMNPASQDDEIPDADCARGQFHALRKAEGLTPTAAFTRLLRFTPRTDGSIRERLESVLLGGDEFDEADATSARLVSRLLDSWERELAPPR